MARAWMVFVAAGLGVGLGAGVARGQDGPAVGAGPAQIGPVGSMKALGVAHFQRVLSAGPSRHVLGAKPGPSVSIFGPARIVSALSAVQVERVQPAKQEAGRANDPTRGVPPGEPAETLPLVDINFDGGTVNQYINALRKAMSPQPVNAVVSKAAGEVKIAPVTLQRVNLNTALEAIAAAAGLEAGNWRITRIDRGGGNGGPAWMVDYTPYQRAVMPPAPGQPVPAAPDRRNLQIFSLRDITQPMPGDSPDALPVIDNRVVLGALDTALKMSESDEGGPPEVKFHAESGTLIIHGTQGQISAVETLLERLRRDVNERRRAAQQAREKDMAEREQLRARLMQAEARQDAVQKQLEIARRRAAQVEQQVAAGAVPNAELERARSALVEAERDARVGAIEMDTLRSTLQRRDAEQATGGGRHDGGPDGFHVALPPDEERRAAYRALLGAVNALAQKEDMLAYQVDGHGNLDVRASRRLLGPLAGLINHLASVHGEQIPEAGDHQNDEPPRPAGDRAGLREK